MADPQIVTTLRDKQRSILSAISSYERELDKARRDLGNVNAVLAMYGRETDPEGLTAHMSIAKVFKRGEIFALCAKALDAAPEGLDTRELAAFVLREKGADADDAILRRTIAYNIIQIMGSRLKRGSVQSPGKRGNVRLWNVV